MSAAASYASDCGSCDARIEVDDLIRYSEVEQAWVHVRCPWTAAGLAVEETVCPSCWLVHAGECDR